MAEETMKFLTACNKFFGRTTGQDLKSFAAELKQLTNKDRRELAPLLSAELGVQVKAE